MRVEFGVMLALIAVVLWAATPAEGQGQEKKGKNTVKLRKAEKDGVEIEVTSDRAFPAIGARPVLYVGKEEFKLSRYGQGGSLGALIFPLTAEEFAKVKDGDPITVRYQPDSQGVWEFGKLDKKALGK